VREVAIRHVLARRRTDRRSLARASGVDGLDDLATVEQRSEPIPEHYRMCLVATAAVLELPPMASMESGSLGNSRMDSLEL
jgi:hypothetical protein